MLGLVSGEHNCHTAYPRCPRTEDELLHYLNNHRGGFFRFFNGGAAFGDDLNSQYNPNQYQQSGGAHQYYQQNHQYPRPQPPPPPQNQPSDDGTLQSSLSALQNIADAVNNGGGLNLSNLGANANLFSGLAGLLNGGGSGSGSGLGSSGFDLSSLASLVGGGNQNQQYKPAKAPPADDQGQSLTELVGNLLTGFVGQRFNGRKIKKRSIDVNEQNSTDFFEYDSDEPNYPKKISAFKLKLATSRSRFKFPDEIEEIDERPEDVDGKGEVMDIEGRTVNSKSPTYSNDNRYEDKFVFDSNRDNEQYNLINKITGPTLSPNYASNSQSQVYSDDDNNNDEFRIVSNHRSPKRFKFGGAAQLNDDSNFKFYQSTPKYQNSVTFGESGNEQIPSKMIFPDRTGTGNLRFDHDELDGSNYNRRGKILYGNQRPQNGGANRVSFETNANRYSSDTQVNTNRPYFNNNYNQNNNNHNNQQNYPTYNRYTTSSSSNRDDNSSHNIYVTNGEGKIVYYINAHGKKITV